MPQPINIKFVSQYENDGFKQAEADLKKFEAQYTKFAKTPLTVSQFSTSLQKMFKDGLDVKKIEKYSGAWVTKYVQSMVLGGNTTAQFNKELASFVSKVSLVDAKLARNLEPTIKQLVNDYKPMIAETEKASGALGNFGKQFKDQFFGIMARTAVTAVTLKAFGALKQYLNESSQAAAEAEQKFSKLQTVFDGMASAGERASQLASKIGVAQSTSANALSTIGDLLQAQGATVAESLQLASQWAEQLQDIINFKDIPMTLDEFASSFMAGAAGNTRNFRQFGSIVKESAVQVELERKGFDKLTGSALEYQKMLTRAEMALEQQKNAIGATQREWDTVLSINRRLTEAQKEHKELIGTQLNESLKGIKKWWTEILEESNKALKTQKEYAEWAENGKSGNFASAYNLNNEKDYAVFSKTLRRAYQQNYGKSEGERGDYNNVFTTSFLMEQMDIFGASVEDIISVLPNLRSDIIDSLNLYQKEIELRRKNQEKQEQLNLELEKAQSNYEALQDTLNAIAGVKITTSSLISGMTGNNFESYYQGKQTSDINTAIQQVVDATAQSMGKAFEQAIGDFKGSDLLKMQVESAQKVAQMAWNDAIGRGVNPETDDTVKKAIESYTNLKEQLDTQIETEKALEEAKKAELKAVEDLQKKLEDWDLKIGEYDAEQKYKYMPESFSEYFDIKSKWEKDLLGSGSEQETEKINTLYSKMASDLKRIKDKQFVYADIVKLEELLAENPQQLADIMESYGLGDTQNAKATATEDYIASQLSDFFGSTELGEFANGIIEGFQQGGIWGAIVNAVLSILDRIDGFQTLLDLGEEFLNMFAEMFEPLMPMIVMMAETFNALFAPLFKMLFPVFKFIAQAIVIIEGLIGQIVGFFVRLLNCWPFKLGLRNPIEDALNATADDFGVTRGNNSWQTALRIADYIGDMTYQVEKNTEPSDYQDKLDAWNDMYRAGLINLTEYQSLWNNLSGLNYDNVKTTDLGAYYNGRSNTTIVYQDDVKITIDGTNLSADEIATKVAQIYERRNRAGSALAWGV